MDLSQFLTINNVLFIVVAALVVTLLDELYPTILQRRENSFMNYLQQKGKLKEDTQYPLKEQLAKDISLLGDLAYTKYTGELEYRPMNASVGLVEVTQVIFESNEALLFEIKHYPDSFSQVTSIYRRHNSFARCKFKYSLRPGVKL